MVPAGQTFRTIRVCMALAEYCSPETGEPRKLDVSDGRSASSKGLLSSESKSNQGRTILIGAPPSVLRKAARRAGMTDAGSTTRENGGQPDLRNLFALRVEENRSDQAVPHSQVPHSHPFSSYDELKNVYDAHAGFLLHTEPGVPLWVGEFGTCQTLDCGANSDWFVMYIRYMKENDLGWSYWALNGAQSSGAGRKYDSIEDYGLLSPDYQHIAAPKLVELLRTVQN
jgi:hypothetical protein